MLKYILPPWRIVEKHGCIGNKGKRIFGTAALLHFLHGDSKRHKSSRSKIFKFRK